MNRNRIPLPAAILIIAAVIALAYVVVTVAAEPPGEEHPEAADELQRDWCEVSNAQA